MNAEDNGELPDGWAAALIPYVCELNPAKPKAADHAEDLLVTFVPMPAVVYLLRHHHRRERTGRTLSRPNARCPRAGRLCEVVRRRYPDQGRTHALEA